MKGIKAFSLLAFALMAFTKAETPDDEFCEIKNTAFQAGEEISYTVYYSVAGIYIDAGNATFTNVLEYKKYENVTFNRNANTAVTTEGVFKVPNCIQDVLSAISYARNIDFNKYKPNDKIPFTMFLDNGVFNMYIRYLGKETVKTKYGKFRAFKFKPLLLKGTIFQGGEKMTVWVSDDANHIPIRIESPIVVGKVKVDMMRSKNLRHPLTSLIKLKGG